MGLTMIPSGWLSLHTCVRLAAFRLAPGRMEEERNASAAYSLVRLKIERRRQILQAIAVSQIPISIANPRARTSRKFEDPPELTAEDMQIASRWQAVERTTKDVLDEARTLLRGWLASGTLASYQMRNGDGDIVPIAMQSWRTQTALSALSSGSWPDAHGGWFSANAGQVVVRQADLLPLLPAEPAAETERSQTYEACKDWVFSQYEAEARAGSKLTRFEAMKRNKDLAKPYADDWMREAIRHVPKELKLQRGKRKP